MAEELLSVSPSPSRDQDVFGKELRLSEGERKQLSTAGDIFLSKTVHIDTHSKKGDGTEPRTLVISSSRCYILVQNPPTKMETSFNFLRIQQLQCSSDKLTFHLSGEAKPRELLATRQDSVEVIALITAQLKNVFPKTPLEMFMKVTFDPDSLRNEVSRLRDDLTAMMERVDPSSIAGFLTAYAFLCNFYGVEYNREVSWYLKNVCLAHGLREMKLSDFDHLSPKDFLPVVSSLRHNHFFEGIVERDGKLGPEIVEELSHVLATSHSIKTLEFPNCGLKPDSTIKLSGAIKNNPRASLTSLNLSDNIMDDKAVESLGSALESLSHGLQQLTLANCKMSVKGASALANSMKQNKHMQFSLVHLDLSSNPLGPDTLGALSFIQETQTISALKLSNCGLLLDSIVPVLIRGCTQHLCELDLSSNTGKGKKAVHSPSVASGLQQFCSSSIAIRSLNFSNCKLTSTAVMKMLEGLAVNPNVSGVKLDVSCNDLGGSGAGKMFGVVGRVSCLQQLNISECSLEQNMADIVTAVTNNRSLRHLMMGRNFSSKAGVRVTAVQQLSALLSREDCQLTSLCLEDSQLKELTNMILEALVDNTSLAKINLSGNQMGNRGACSLAKALLSNCALTEVNWDHNDTQLRGFQEISAALRQNYTLRVMPLPLHDIGRARKGVEECVQMIQQYLCRNHSDERLKVEIAARHRARLLTASQQSSAVGRELVQLEDLLEWAQAHFPSHEVIKQGSEVKELANRAIKLTDGLYSPKVESEQFRTITGEVRQVLEQYMESLFVDHIKTRSRKMVDKTIGICDGLLSEETQMRLQNLVVCEKGDDFAQAKKDVLRHALPEIVNHVSDSNVDVAANISELIVEHTLQSLEKVNHKLFKLQKETQAKHLQTADAKVSRNFTFRVQEDASPAKKKKKRVRRPDSEDEDEVDLVNLPAIPLTVEGPTLQHLGKTRPKPARVHRGRPSKSFANPAADHTPTAADSTPSSDHTPTAAAPTSDPTPTAANSTPPAADSTPPAPDSTPLAASPTPPQPKVALKPPSPQVAEKKIKEMLEKRKSSAALADQEVKRVGGDPVAKSNKEKQEGEEEDTSKSSSDERCTSEEDEEHRTVLQLTTGEEEHRNVVQQAAGEEEHRTVTQQVAGEEEHRTVTQQAAGEEEHRTVTQQAVGTSSDNDGTSPSGPATSEQGPEAAKQEVKETVREDTSSKDDESAISTESAKPTPAVTPPTPSAAKPTPSAGPLSPAVTPPTPSAAKPTPSAAPLSPAVTPPTPSAVQTTPSAGPLSPAVTPPTPSAVQTTPSAAPLLPAVTLPTPSAVLTTPSADESAPPTPTSPAPGEGANSKGSSAKSRGSVKSSGDKGNGEAITSGRDSMADWEVIETASEVASKKPPPAVKEKKPRNSSRKDAPDGKKSPILPPSQVAPIIPPSQVAPILPPGPKVPQKGPSKNESRENGDVKNSPAPPPKSPKPLPSNTSPVPAKSTPSPVPAKSTPSPVPAKSTPSPVPKPRPKPTIRKKVEGKTNERPVDKPSQVTTEP